MIIEDYVSFETAKLLKEKGFDEECRARYDYNGTLHYEKYPIESSGAEMHNSILCPTYQMVVKWLRKVHNLYIEISLSCDREDKNAKIFDASIFNLQNQRYKKISNIQGYEQACEAALKYCLEKKINFITMATIKSYTDLPQSKKLAEILPIESSDMCLTFVNNVWNPVWGKANYIYQLQKNCYEPDYTKDDYVDFDEFEPKVVPAWSLAALLGVIPKRINEFNVLRIDISTNDFAIWYDEIGSGVNNDLPDITKESAVDACVIMIEKLHELNLL